MLEFYFPKLKAKKMAEPMTGKAYRARGGSIRYGLQAQHEGSMSLPKYVPISEYESLGFSAEEAVAALPAYEPKPAPVPADPTLDVPSASPEPVEPTNANFSADESLVAYPVSWEGKDDNDGLIYGIEYLDDDGEVADVEWFSSVFNRDAELDRYLKQFEATSGSGTIDHDRIDREEEVSVIMRHDSPYTAYDWDSDIDLSEEEEDELVDGIHQEVGGDPDEDDNDFYINVDTADGEADVYVQTHTEYGSGRFYGLASENVHQFKGENSECCGEPIYRFKSEGDWLCMACDFMQAEFTPEELTESSAIHGDFDTASINYSGHQNLVARAETKWSCKYCGWDLKTSYLRPKPEPLTLADEECLRCGISADFDGDGKTVEEWMEFNKADFGAETQEFTFKYSVYDKETGDSIEESEVTVTASNEREARGEAMRMLEEGGLEDEEFHIWNAESLVEEPDFIPEGDGRALGQQNSSINLSPLHAEDEEMDECPVCGTECDYDDLCYDCDNCLDCCSCDRMEAEGMSRNAKMALGFTAIGLGIAFWKGKDLMTLWDSVKEKLDK